MTVKVDPDALITAIGDAIVVCNVDGKIILWNPAAERIFGFSRDEAIGRSLDIIIPERMRARHWEGYRVTMETGVTKYGNDVLRVPAINKSGGTISVTFTVALLQGNDGKVEAIASVIRDETDKFYRDRALRKRLSELEAKVSGD